MKNALRSVSFGPASWTLLALLLASFGPVLEGWFTTGQFPTGEAWISAALALGLAVLRGSQAIVAKLVGGQEVEGEDIRDAFLEELDPSDVEDGVGELPEDAV